MKLQTPEDEAVLAICAAFDAADAKLTEEQRAANHRRFMAATDAIAARSEKHSSPSGIRQSRTANRAR